MLAGMFGVGGGVVLVPALHYVFQAWAPRVSMHLAVATSSACVVLTTMASAAAHQRRGSVNWQLGALLLPGIVVGAAAGSAIAIHLPGWSLAGLFALFELYFATTSLLHKPGLVLASAPSLTGMASIGALIGMLASFVGIGGGSLTVPVLLRRGASFVKAAGTSSVIGMVLALTSSVGYALGGHGVALPHPSLGFIYLPALLATGLCSLLTAPLGVRLVHTLPERYGRWLFAAHLYAVALDMGREACQSMHFPLFH
jgi:uncharacterized membrane protein YfcA